MHKPAITHTLSIFQRIHDSLPPLLPPEVILELKEKLNHAYEDHHISLEELEDIMVYMGKKVWPYMQAFEELYQFYEARLQEKLFEQRATQSIKKKFQLFKQMGGTLADIFAGKVHEIFEHDERVELAEMLVELKRDIRKHAVQAILSKDHKKYSDAVDKYGKLIEEINDIVQTLRKYGDEIEHENWSVDIHDKARAIELSLVYLGPKIDIHEMRHALEYYQGKVREKAFR